MTIISKLNKNRFLLEELIKRDFKKKYKRTVLGMVWSVLSPLLSLMIMNLVFKRLLGNNIEHYTIYLFSGQLVFSYFTDATNGGMSSLMENSDIFTKVNIPKFLFLISKNVSTLINFGLTLAVFFIFVAIDGIAFTTKFFLLLYPIFCLIIFNIGIGLILSAFFMFFRDIEYLYGVATQLLMYLSAIFYSIDTFPEIGRFMFLLNPIYLYIRYFRKIVLENTVPTIQFHLLAAAYALIAVVLGAYIYKKYNHKFLYYV